ncbi:MAG: flagellar basal body P-ring formation chaperone FlgA [Proteobacteria bacterium]|nr:flagellar basal body P-ring formation chaperone FlgA [Pseudomonadota bacterium]
MNNIGLFLISCCLFLSPLSVAAQVTVQFKANAVVTGPKIVLADIAIIQPPDSETETLGQLQVATAPAPGKTKELSVVTVINTLRNHPEAADVDWQGSQSIVVERAGVRLTKERMQEMIATYLKENAAIFPSAEIRFSSIQTPDEMMLPAGTLTWKITPSRPGIVGSTSFTIALFIDGKPSGTSTVRGRLELVAEVLTAATTLHKGDVVTTENVVMQRQNIGGVSNPLFVRDDILGKQVARTVAAGTILKADHLVLPPVIKEGEMVKISARKGSMLLTTNGLAKNDGRVGETISVKNISSNKLIYCRVDGPGAVSVEF